MGVSIRPVSYLGLGCIIWTPILNWHAWILSYLVIWRQVSVLLQHLLLETQPNRQTTQKVGSKVTYLGREKDKVHVEVVNFYLFNLKK